MKTEPCLKKNQQKKHRDSNVLSSTILLLLEIYGNAKNSLPLLKSSATLFHVQLCSAAT